MNDKTKVHPMVELRGELEAMAPQFGLVLPKSVPPERFVRVVLNAVNGNPDLLADRRSLLTECMKCATDGLVPDGREATIQPFWDKRAGKKLARYMPMIGGIIKRLANSANLKELSAELVYANDEFRYVLGDDPHIEHIMASGDRGELVGAYSIIKTKDGGVWREYMSRRELEDVAAASPAGDKGPWGGPFRGEMCRKVVSKRNAKRVPMSAEDMRLLERDDDLYEFPGAPKLPEHQPSAARGVAGFLGRTEPTPSPEEIAGAQRDMEKAAATDVHGAPNLSDALALHLAGDHAGALDIVRSLAPKEQAEFYATTATETARK